MASRRKKVARFVKELERSGPRSGGICKPAKDYALTWNGHTTRHTREEYERLEAEGRIRKGTMISHPGGWCVAGANIWDVFEID